MLRIESQLEEANAKKLMADDNVVTLNLQWDIHSRRGTMTQFIDALEKEEKDELVKRCDDPKDRRAMLIELTVKGAAVLKQVLPEHLNRLSLVTQALSRNERKQLLSLMEKLAAGVSQNEFNQNDS